MTIEQELTEIQNKDLSAMQVEELREYKDYLIKYRENATKRAQVVLWTIIYYVIGGFFVLLSLAFLMRSVFSITKDLSFIPLISGYGFVAICVAIVLVLTSFRKKAIKNREDIKRVSSEKISETDNYIALVEFKKSVNTVNYAPQTDITPIPGDNASI